MKARVAYNMLSFAKRLKEAGIEPKAAEAQAQVTLEVIVGLLDENLATKQDFQLAKQDLMLVKSELLNPIAHFHHLLKETHSSLEHQIEQNSNKLRAEFKQDIASLRAEFKQDIAEVRAEIADLRTEFKQEIADLRTEFKQDIAYLRAELKQDIANLNDRISRLETTLTLRLGAMMLGCMTIAGIFFHFIH